jgi:hypothetical protein
MHLPASIALCLLPACALGPGALEPVGPQGQEPKPGPPPRLHIDQQEPPRVDARPFRTEPAPWTLTADVGVGEVDVRIGGTLLDDRADATFARLAIDSGRGAGLHAEVWSSDTELFAGRRVFDGVAPAPADASLEGAQVYPHLCFELWQARAVRLPLRVGLFADWQQLDHERARVEIDWLSLGPKLQLEPIWRIVGDPRSALDLFVRLGGEGGPAWITEEFVGGDDRDETLRWSIEGALGLRCQLRRWHLEAGYQIHRTHFGSIDSDLHGIDSRTDLGRQQLFFGLGVWF